MIIKADPYDYPFNKDLRPANTALIVVDMQFDFCGEGGYVDKRPVLPSNRLAEFWRLRDRGGATFCILVKVIV
jgi:hypothetical protein